MDSIELEYSYLAKELPQGLRSCKSKEMLDIYIPDGIPHAPIRIRKRGEKYEITKKCPENEDDHSRLIEQTIVLTEKEFLALRNEIKGRRVHKTRYFYPHNGRTAEIDVFMDDLEGLVLIDFEFENEEEKSKFKAPDFCLVRVRGDGIQGENFLAGGMLCGKKYSDLEPKLKKLGYKKLFLE